jgi:hypothetical protein
MGGEEKPKFWIIAGVELKPGVHVFCDDRDELFFDQEGVILSVLPQGGYVVQFGTATHELSEMQIWPTAEEQNSESARARRAVQGLRVFLCHGKEDKTAVRRLYETLKKERMRPWLDEEDIEPGQLWDWAIQDAVKECHVILVCLSEASANKTGYVQKEIKFALDRADEKPEGTRFIIPVRLEDCEVPRRLRPWQWVDLHHADGIGRLLKVLKQYAIDLGL